jgi:hypothetical protein
VTRGIWAVDEAEADSNYGKLQADFCVSGCADGGW